MVAVRWLYYGPIVVMLDDGDEGEGWGRLGEPVDAPDVWAAMVRDLPEPANQATDLLRRPIRIRLPGGGEAESLDVIPVLTGRRRGRFFHLLMLSGYDMPRIPEQNLTVALGHRLRWWARFR